MKYVGFITEHENSIVKVGKPLSMMLNYRQSNLLHKEKTLYYIENNTRLISFLHYKFDGSTPIGPHIIFTDGEWIWPSYLSYYIRKHDNFCLHEDFVNDITAKKFIPPVLSQEELIEVEKFYVATHKNNSA